MVICYINSDANSLHSAPIKKRQIQVNSWTLAVKCGVERLAILSRDTISVKTACSAGEMQKRKKSFPVKQQLKCDHKLDYSFINILNVDKKSFVERQNHMK